MVIAGAAAALLLIAAAPGWAQKYSVGVGNLGPTHALIAWGTTDGRNTIGRGSPALGRVEVRIAGRTVVEEARNWAPATGLQPDTSYDYEVAFGGRRIGGGRLRTWAAKADRLAFFVIGDYGTGDSGQRRVAEAMRQEFERRRETDNPVRFVLTTGDNIYADLNLGYAFLRSGDSDRDWRSKFFRPYERLLSSVPFYPTLGNHDGNSTEGRGDLAQYLDNFFFPGGNPARWYEFGYAGLADFFALDFEREHRAGRARAPVFRRRPAIPVAEAGAGGFARAVEDRLLSPPAIQRGAAARAESHGALAFRGVVPQDGRGGGVQRPRAQPAIQRSGEDRRDPVRGDRGGRFAAAGRRDRQHEAAGDRGVGGAAALSCGDDRGPHDADHAGFV